MARDIDLQLTSALGRAVASHSLTFPLGYLWGGDGRRIELQAALDVTP